MVWAIGLLVLWLVFLYPRHPISPGEALMYLIALVALLLAVKRPDRSLLALIVLLPFQNLILAKLFAMGLPVSAAKGLGTWKEVLGIAVVIAGVRGYLASGRSADTVDRLAFAFVALCGLYVALQAQIAPGAPAATSVKLLGFRETAGFVLLLLGARHADLGQGFGRRACGALFVVGGIISGVGVFEAVDPTAWNSFVVSTLHYPTYEYRVLGSLPANEFNVISYGFVAGHRFVRIGSVFLNTLDLSWYLILPFALGLERILRRGSSAWVLGGTTLIGIALLLTQTRSSILGAVVVVVALTVRPAAGRHRHWHTQAALVLVGVMIVGLPAALETGVAGRIERTTSAGNTDTAGHVSGFKQGIDAMAGHLLGLGLGTGAGTGQRYQVSGYVIPEDNYLEVGDELGIFGFVLFVLLTIALVVELRKTARVSTEAMVAAVWAASAGLATSELFLQTWSDFSTAWTFWALAGAALGVVRQPVAQNETATLPGTIKLQPSAPQPQSVLASARR